MTLEAIWAYDRISSKRTFSRSKLCVEPSSIGVIVPKIFIFLHFALNLPHRRFLAIFRHFEDLLAIFGTILLLNLVEVDLLG